MSGEPVLPAGSRAILIGVPHYQDPAYRSYTAVGNSVDGMYHLLVESGLCGWSKEQVEKIVDPTNAGRLMGQLRELAQNTTGVLLLYFVGHGQPSEHTGELCLAVADTDHANPDATGLEYSKIKRMLHSGTPAATRIAILDCCYSGRAIGLGADDDGIQLAELSECVGAYTLTAADGPADVPPDGEGTRRADAPPDGEGNLRTAFTGELLDLLTRDGVPGGPQGISLGAIFPRLRHRLAAKGLPRPNQRSDDSAAAFVFARNAAAAAPTAAEPDRKTPDSGSPALVGEPGRGQPQAGRRALATHRSTGRRTTRHRLPLVAAVPALALIATLGWALIPWPQTTPQDDAPPTPQIVQTGMMAGLAPARTVVFSPDGRTLAAVHQDGSTRLWNVATQQQVGQISFPVSSRPRDLVFSPDNYTLITSRIEGNEGVVERWDASGQRIGEPFIVEMHPKGTEGYLFEGLALSRDGRAVAVGTEENVQLWDLVSGQKTGEPISDQDGAVFSPAGSVIATVKSDGRGDLVMWDTDKEKGKRGVRGVRTGAHLAYAFSPDGRMLVTAFTESHSSETAEVVLWDASTPQACPDPQCRRFTIPDFESTFETFRQVALAPDGRSVATIQENLHGDPAPSSLRLWDVDSAQQIGSTIEGINSMAFSPDGRTLATAGKDNIVRLWNVPQR